MLISQDCSLVNGYPGAADLGALLGTFQRDLLLLRSAKKFLGEKKAILHGLKIAKILDAFW